jgi:uroporphyrinogen-III synthase
LFRSLDNRILAITRKDCDAREFSQLVSSEGGKTIALPTIDIIPKEPKVIEELLENINEKNYDYCVFMSSQAVSVLFELADKINKTEQIIYTLNSRNVIAIGPKTRDSLIHNRINVKFMPENYSSKGLYELFSKMDLVNKRIIIPRSSTLNEFTSKFLSNLEIDIDQIFLYTIRTAKPTDVWKDFVLLLEQAKIDAIIFTSASSVRSFLEIMKNLQSIFLLKRVKSVISIGPLTSKELRTRNISYYESKEHTIKGTFELAKSLLY